MFFTRGMEALSFKCYLQAEVLEGAPKAQGEL